MTVATGKQATRTEGPGAIAAVAGLMLLAFVSPGAWRIDWIPPVPEAQAWHLSTLGVWALVFALGLVRYSRPDRRLVWGLAAILASSAVSWIAGGWVFQAALYDIYASMPLVQWLAFPAAFALAASLQWGRRSLRVGASLVVGSGALFSAILAYQQITQGGVTHVFGTTAYSITALAGLVPVAVGFGVGGPRRHRWAWFAGGAVISICLGAFSGSLTGSLTVVFALVCSALTLPALWHREGPARGHLGVVAAGVATVMAIGLLVVQIPAVSGAVVGPSTFGESESLASRSYLWMGAQEMIIERPVFGFGPAGYRVAAVEYLAPEALSFGPDVPGNADPTVYSPQSPHSIFWEIAVRLGMIGVVAFMVMLALWALVLRDRLGSDPDTYPMRAGLAAGFLTAVFAMLVNPAFFAVGLFPAVAAGLAVSPGDQAKEPARPRRVARIALGIAGIATVAVAVWLVYGQWVAESVSPQEPVRAMRAHEQALKVLPGHPMIERRLLEMRLTYAIDSSEVAEIQRQVDAAPSYIGAYAPNMVSFAGRSLAQAERTGRTDVSWERATLERAAERIPPIPSLVAERLHVALIEGDAEAISQAALDAERWGGPYPFTDEYLARAELLAP